MISSADWQCLVFGSGLEGGRFVLRTVLGPAAARCGSSSRFLFTGLKAGASTLILSAVFDGGRFNPSLRSETWGTPASCLLAHTDEIQTLPVAIKLAPVQLGSGRVGAESIRYPSFISRT